MNPTFDSLLFSWDLKATVLSLGPWGKIVPVSCGAEMAGELSSLETVFPLKLKQGHTSTFLVS